jgi:hypothetical protein
MRHPLGCNCPSLFFKGDTDEKYFQIAVCGVLAIYHYGFIVWPMDPNRFKDRYC